MQEMQETIFKLGRKHTSGESLSPITKNDRSGTLHSCSELVSCILSALRTFFFSNCPQVYACEETKYLDTKLPLIVMKNGGSKLNPKSHTVIKSLFAFDS